MSMGMKVSIDTRNLKRRMDAIQRKLDKNGSLTVKDIARWGRDQIITRMPKSSKNSPSAKSIVAIEQVNKKGYHSAVITRRGQPHPTKHFASGEWFNLPRWMLMDGNYMKVWGHDGRNGHIVAARNVPNELRTKFKRRVEIDVANSIA